MSGFRRPPRRRLAPTTKCPKTLLAGADSRTGPLAVVVTFDEGDNRAHNQILTAVLHKGLRATTMATRLNHLALSLSASGLVGRSGLRGEAPNLLASFGQAPAW